MVMNLPQQESPEWRRHGMEHRKRLLRQDELQGGTSFLLNSMVPIQNYFDIGERVSIDGAIL